MLVRPADSNMSGLRTEIIGLLVPGRCASKTEPKPKHAYKFNRFQA